MLYIVNMYLQSHALKRKEIKTKVLDSIDIYYCNNTCNTYYCNINVRTCSSSIVMIVVHVSLVLKFPSRDVVTSGNKIVISIFLKDMDYISEHISMR